MALNWESNAALRWHAAMPRVLVAHTDKSTRQLLKLQLAGLGWFGKNTNLLNPALGSFFFLGALVLDVELPISSRESEFDVPLIPVIFLTPREDAFERAVRLGALACLTTPLRTEELLDAVARCARPGGEARSRMGFRAPKAA